MKTLNTQELEQVSGGWTCTTGTPPRKPKGQPYTW